MRHYIHLIILFACPLALMGQGAGFGFQFDFGAKNNFNVGEGFEQKMKTYQHSFYVRWFSNNGRRAHQLVNGFRYDSIGFKNNSPYFDENLRSVSTYNVDASLHRIAWRTGYMEHLHIIGNPGKFVLAFNYGLFYEYTLQLKRKSLFDDLEYHMYNEQNRHNLIFATGLEARIWWFTVGYKWEYMFFDMINHDHINRQPTYPGNTSELSGVVLSPSMSYIYFVFNFDFFNKQEE